jgi:MFS family permease
MTPLRPGARPGWALAVLFAANTLNFFDRAIAGALAEPIRKEWRLSDVEVGWLATAFILIYAVVGLPLGRLADRFQRTRILAAGILVWSAFTALSGAARNYLQLFAARLGVGIGEASCAPAATSMIGDLYPAERRARALSIFMLGLPVGLALSFAASTTIAQAYGWRAAFFAAGAPGLLCALAALALREPPRGAREAHAVGAERRRGSAYRIVLGIPTMRWLFVSGALHSINMYSLGTFLLPYLMRFHGVSIREAGLIATAVYGLSGLPGLLLGGAAADGVARRSPDGKLLFGALVLLPAAPLFFFALRAPAGELVSFSLFAGLGCALLYVYYSAVYPTIHDVTEPALRGTAMALYFFAMYAIGAALGPIIVGAASDYFSERAALEAGIDGASQALLEPYRAEGLRQALLIVPVASLLLGAVLLAGSRRVKKDREDLESWMEGASAAE